jgi:hypothetical protein
MPKVVAPLLSQSAVGTLGGLLYRSGTYGPIVSRSSSSPALRTPAQSAHRGALRRAHDAWLTLTPLEQSSWLIFAGPHETARNVYTAAFIRLSYADILPLPSAIHVAQDEYIFNITADVYAPPASDPPLLSLRWSVSGNPQNVLNIWVYQTWSNRELPKPAKFVRRSYVAAADMGVDLFLPIDSPVVWVRIEVINWDNGQVSAKHLIRANRHVTLPLMVNTWTQPISILPHRT